MSATTFPVAHSYLGRKVKDRVTGFTGVVTSISFDLYGCVQGWVVPQLGEDGKVRDSSWFDLNRLQILKKEPVLEVPTFAPVAKITTNSVPGGQELGSPDRY